MLKNNNKSTLFILIGSVLAGLAGWFLTDNYINQEVVTYKQTFDEERQAVDVVVSAYDLKVGDVLTLQNAQIRQVPQTYVPNDAVRPDEFSALLEGRQLKHPVNSGEPILKIHVSTVKVDGLSRLLEPGQRAITIPVDSLDTISGFLKPGDSVDVFVTVKDGAQERTAPLVQGMKVLATGQDVDDGIEEADSKDFSEVTLAVTPLQATKLIHAQSVGDIAVVLRQQEDKTVDFEDYVTLDNLVDVKQAAPAPPPPPPPPPPQKSGFGFELIRGGNRS